MNHSCLVSILEVKVAGFWMVAEVNPLAVVPDDVLGSGVLVVTSLDQFQHPRGREREKQTRHKQLYTIEPLPL